MNIQSWNNTASRATQWLLLLIIITIPFSIRHVFDSSWNFQTGAYSDFTSLSIYITDILIVILVSIRLITTPWLSIPRLWKYAALFSVSWLVLELAIQDRSFMPLQLYFSLRIAILIVFALVVSQIRVSREKISLAFVILGGIQSLIGIVQFVSQKSIGLYYLGESHLSPETLGVAKIVSHGTKYIRAYGTFPHSNLLAAFLVVSTVFNLYLIAKYYQIPRGNFISRGKLVISREIIPMVSLIILLFLNVFGLFVSFSRAGVLGLVLSGSVFYFYLYQNTSRNIFSKQIALFIAVVAIPIAILWPFLSTRATITDNATKERVFYNTVGLKIALSKSFFGIGAGTSVLHMKQYSETDLKPWEIQPIHNFYLISWAEWGIATLAWLFLLLYPIFLLFKRKMELWSTSLLAIGVSFLLLFLFDHYFYTIWPTQVLIWLILGIILGSTVQKATYDTVSEQ